MRPIVHYAGHSANSPYGGDPYPGAWYVNGELVASDMNQEDFLRNFIETRFGQEHLDGDVVMATLDDVEANGKRQRIERLELDIARAKKAAREAQAQLDKLTSS